MCSSGLEVSPSKFFDFVCDSDEVARFAAPVTAVGHKCSSPVLDHILLIYIFLVMGSQTVEHYSILGLIKALKAFSLIGFGQLFRFYQMSLAFDWLRH